MIRTHAVVGDEIENKDIEILIQMRSYFVTSKIQEE